MRDAAGLRTLVSNLVRNSPPHRSIWVWSAGCSSGEEPYSLAMALLEAGRTPRILATDVNRLALRRGSEGYYPERSLQRLSRSWCRKYFQQHGDGMYRIAEQVRRCVTFELHNFLKSDGLPAGWSRFDAVVCRNALIYFERDQALEVIERLTHACRPGGFLLLGAIERPLFWLGDSSNRNQAAELVQLPTDATLANPVAAAIPIPVHDARSDASAASGANRAATPADLTPSPADERVMYLLERADAMDREGQVENALALLDRAVERRPLMAAAHLSRGLLLKRLGRIHEAIDALRAARFLAADGWLAPYQLGLCLEAVGETDEAAEAYRHALSILDMRGASGLYRETVAVENLATTVAEVCRTRIQHMNTSA
jgi:chemotaxis protein methyltransferase CheR